MRRLFETPSLGMVSASFIERHSSCMAESIRSRIARASHGCLKWLEGDPVGLSRGVWVSNMERLTDFSGVS